MQHLSAERDFQFFDLPGSDWLDYKRGWVLIQQAIVRLIFPRSVCVILSILQAWWLPGDPFWRGKNALKKVEGADGPAC